MICNLHNVAKTNESKEIAPAIGVDKRIVYSELKSNNNMGNGQYFIQRQLIVV